MEMTSVSSSNIAEVGYDDDTSTLGILFNSGLLYYYSDVPKTVYEELLNAGSVGRYFNQNIRGVYNFNRI